MAEVIPFNTDDVGSIDELPSEMRRKLDVMMYGKKLPTGAGVPSDELIEIAGLKRRKNCLYFFLTSKEGLLVGEISKYKNQHKVECRYKPKAWL